MTNGFPNFFVQQTPRFDNQRRKRRQQPRRENQVLSRKGIIRPDKRKKVRYI